MRNAELAEIFREISLYLEMQGVQFKPRAYEKVAYALEALEEPVAEVYKRGGIKALKEIPGVGEAIAEKIEEIIETGKLKYHEELMEEVPVDIRGLTSIEGVGPKMVKVLYDHLGVRNVSELERAARGGKVRGLPHLGGKDGTEGPEGGRVPKTGERALHSGCSTPDSSGDSGAAESYG